MRKLLALSALILTALSAPVTAQTAAQATAPVTTVQPAVNLWPQTRPLGLTIGTVGRVTYYDTIARRFGLSRVNVEEVAGKVNITATSGTVVRVRLPNGAFWSVTTGAGLWMRPGQTITINTVAGLSVEEAAGFGFETFASLK